jgi:hypothetical protein
MCAFLKMFKAMASAHSGWLRSTCVVCMSEQGTELANHGYESPKACLASIHVEISILFVYLVGLRDRGLPRL